MISARPDLALGGAAADAGLIYLASQAQSVLYTQVLQSYRSVH